eukprot:7760618-Karenia_brevis.AAC.1
MTLFDAAPGKKNVDAKEEEIGTNTEKSFDAIKNTQIVPNHGNQIESNEKFENGITSTQKEKSASMFQKAAKAKVLKGTNIWKKFAITLCSLLLYVYGFNGGQTKGIGQAASGKTKSGDIKQSVTKS